MNVPVRLCTQCRSYVPIGEPCSGCARRRDRNRPNALYRRWYNTPRWRALRRLVLHQRDLCCVDCRKQNRSVLSTEADHIVPWMRGATEQEKEALFFDIANVQGLCASCHAEKTRRGE